jgi:hypothetical protein
VTSIAERLGLTDGPGMRAERRRIVDQYAMHHADGSLVWCHDTKAGKVSYGNASTAMDAAKAFTALLFHRESTIHPCGTHYHVTTDWRCNE